ncbi:MAG: BMP family ABC transporter substrate-binding protein [Lachnospiraceae bacterium]|nr:BMP family ABC transporter substrate-binding protein [Lachnospiraceae bacterium]
MNKHKLKQRILLAAAGVVLLAVLVTLILPGMQRGSEYKIGLIITGKTTDSGWNSTHYNGVVSACEQLGTELIVKEDIAEGNGSCAEAIHQLVKDGVGMIILSSYSYPMEVKEIIDIYPDIAFYAISSEHVADNLTSYFGRMYQARYLAGIVAGMQTDNNSIGYVAAMPNNEVNRGINAFTLGVRSVNPEAEVYVSWTNSWDNKEKEVAAAESLITDKYVDVITYHQNQHYTAQTADAAGVYSIGYNEVANGLSDKYLTTAVWDWNSLYYQIIREYVQGQSNAVERRWFDIGSGVVGLAELSPQVSDETRHAVENAKARLNNSNDVFSGVIYDNSGTLRCGEGESLSDDALLTDMDWFVDGVVIYE